MDAETALRVRVRIAIRAAFVTVGLILGNLITGTHAGERSLFQIAAVLAVVLTICVWPGGVVE